MKIISKGLPPEKRTYRATCTNCHAVFEFEKGEAKASPASLRDTELLKIDCPVCGRERHIDAAHWLEKPPSNNYSGGRTCDAWRHR